jgi:hypothetical protein
VDGRFRHRQEMKKVLKVAKASEEQAEAYSLSSLDQDVVCEDCQLCISGGVADDPHLRH